MVVKIIELIGSSKKGWVDAVQNAVTEAAKTVRNIKAVDVIKTTCKIENNVIAEYRASCRIAFLIEDER